MSNVLRGLETQSAGLPAIGRSVEFSVATGIVTVKIIF